jgi:phosphomannomutase
MVHPTRKISAIEEQNFVSMVSPYQPQLNHGIAMPSKNLGVNMEKWRSLSQSFGVQSKLDEQQFITAFELLIPSLYSDDPIKSGEAAQLREALFVSLKNAMRSASHLPKTKMKFGTSGWRGILFDDFTINNVGCVTQGLIEALLAPEQWAAVGVSSAEELKQRGCVLAHDTRIMGPEFVETASRVLLAHGVKLYNIGMATTPEVSTAIAETNAAFSINFTPSHNPFSYHGYKFNPADGGPATKELTTPVADRANQLLEKKQGYTQVSEEEYAAAKADPSRYQSCDPIALYKQSLKKRFSWLDLDALIKQINESDFAIFIDNGFGATTGKYEGLLAGVAPGKLNVYNNERDYLFGGKNREPSVENFRLLQEKMKASPAKLVVGVMNDGDGDRFVGGGREAVLVMNKFGPLVVRYLSQAKGVTGDVTRSVMTSHMADASQKKYLPQGKVIETAVGFQFLKSSIPTSVNSWEESDGMSPKNWSRDKDGLLAALLLISMVLHYQKPAEALLADIESELGSFFFERQKVSGKLIGDALSQALRAKFGVIQPKQKLSISGREFTVEKVVTLDGTKVVFGNGWWFGVRASGTEPVVRPYVETFSGEGVSVEEAKTWQQNIMNWLKAEITGVVA